MKIRHLLIVLVLIPGASALYGHELFIKMDSYFLEPGQTAHVPILNGTFAKSEGSIMVDRVVAASIAGPHGVVDLDKKTWDATTDTTYVTIRTGQPGTYVLGVSTRSRLIELDATTFNEYLAGEGIPDVLEERRRTGKADQDAVERYSKHVKAVYQVGHERSAGWGEELGYPAEIVPLANPYQLEVGVELAVRCLVHGKPVANQLVLAGGEGKKGMIGEQRDRTDEDGVVRFKPTEAGKWYVKFIHMAETDEEGVDYESNWATISFAVR